MNIIGVIPTRMASSRFPGKPLTEILGVPMIGHVFHRSNMCRELNGLYVATCDVEIREYIEKIGGKVIMTSENHSRASERTAEAIQKIEQMTGEEIDYVVMIQGDLPLILPEMISEIIAPLSSETDLKVVDMIAQIQTEAEFENPNIVKVVMDKNDFAIYYSREPIPSRKKYNKSVPMWRQPGLIMFEKQTLLNYIKLEPSPLEIIESVDMNRLLENGIKIKYAKTLYPTYFESIDVISDLKNVIIKLAKDKLFNKYGE